MECKICENEIKVGEIVHEVPNDAPGYDVIIVCNECYNLHNSFYYGGTKNV